MVGVGAIREAHAEIVNNKAEDNITRVVPPLPMCQRARCVSVRLEEGDELVVGNASCWAEAIFDVDVSVMEQGAQRIKSLEEINGMVGWVGNHVNVSQMRVAVFPNARRSNK
jgi:hypothetical protein